jgi:site-specific DNA recombinase
VTGASVHRPKPAASFVEAVFPELRIVSDELWQAAQTRLAAEAVATHPAGRQAFWERRRPKHLLTGKVACGCCGGAFSLLGKDYLGCSRAKNAGSCRNTTRVRRSVLERQVLAALGNSLMRPEALEAFCDAFIAEWNRMAAEMSLGARAKQDELKVIERKIANLVVAIEDGLADPGVKQRLEELRARQQVLGDQDGTTMPAPPALHPNLAHVYAKRVAALREALDAGDGEEVLEAARDLIETVVISPPDIPGDPPGIELAGNLMAMLKAGGVNISAGESTFGSCLTAMLAGSTKGEVREKFPSPPVSPR